MLHNFRRAIAFVFLLSFAIFMLSSVVMITLFTDPFNTQLELYRQRSEAGDFINSCNHFIIDTISRHLPDFDEKLSLADAEFSKYMSDIEILSSFIQSQNNNISFKTAYRIACALKHYSIKYEVPFELAIAVAHTESHFDTNARSNYGALGVMQVVWRIHSGLLRANGIFEEELLQEPEYGIAAGCLLLSRYIKDSDSVEIALGRYYGGDYRVYWNRISRSLDFYETHTQKEF